MQRLAIRKDPVAVSQPSEAFMSTTVECIVEAENAAEIEACEEELEEEAASSIKETVSDVQAASIKETVSDVQAASVVETASDVQAASVTETDSNVAEEEAAPPKRGILGRAARILGAPVRLTRRLLKKEMTVEQCCTFMGMDPSETIDAKAAFLRSKGVSDFAIVQAVCCSSLDRFGAVKG